MTNLMIGDKLFKLGKFRDEKELEKVVIKNSLLIFGSKTVYFDVKRRVESPKGDILSIPDGYVLSFSEPSKNFGLIFAVGTTLVHELLHNFYEVMHGRER